jgi:DNA-directed RNA polymerase specialized sigma subunit
MKSEFKMDQPFPGDLTKKEKLPAPEEYYSWKKDPSKQNLSSLLTRVDPIIDKAVTSYAGKAGPALKTKARLMTLDYLNTYDPKKGMALNSYIMQNLQSLHRENAQRSQTVHVPENISLIRNKVTQARQEFESNYGREPSIEELADQTGISQKHIMNMNKYRPTVSGSMKETEKGDSFFIKERNFDDIWSGYVYFDLDPKDKKIFEWTTGYGGTQTIPKQDIAKKLKMTPAAVSFRINKIVAKLEEGSQYGNRS